MAKDQNIILEIEGEDYLIRENVEVVSSMLTLCNTFTVETMQLNDPEFKTSAGQECKLKVDDDVLVDGQIDHTEIEYDPTENSYTITISGRDKTASLVDCTFEFEPNEWKELSVEDILNNLCSPFGIDVIIDASAQSQVSELIETFKINEGEYVVDSLSELCRNHAVLPLNFGDGKLTITQAGTKKAEEELSIGSNIIWSKAISSNLNRYSKYIVKGTGVGNDNKTLSDYIEPSGEYEDSGIKTTRPLVIFVDGPVDSGMCQQRAQWEACIRAGMSRHVVYKYDAFYEKFTGDIWRKNKLVDISDPILDITDEKLIAEVRYVLGESSRSAYLTCVNPATFTLGDPGSINGIGG